MWLNHHHHHSHHCCLDFHHSNSDRNQNQNSQEWSMMIEYFLPSIRSNYKVQHVHNQTHIHTYTHIHKNFISISKVKSFTNGPIWDDHLNRLRFVNFSPHFILPHHFHHRHQFKPRYQSQWNQVVDGWKYNKITNHFFPDFLLYRWLSVGLRFRFERRKKKNRSTNQSEKTMWFDRFDLVCDCWYFFLTFSWWCWIYNQCDDDAEQNYRINQN